MLETGEELVRDVADTGTDFVPGMGGGGGGGEYRDLKEKKEFSKKFGNLKKNFSFVRDLYLNKELSKIFRTFKKNVSFRNLALTWCNDPGKNAMMSRLIYTAFGAKPDIISGTVPVLVSTVRTVPYPIHINRYLRKDKLCHFRHNKMNGNFY
jgi:hypothetical protein